MSFRFLTMACSAFLTAAAIAAPAADPAKADLRRKLEVGESHRYALVIDSSMSISSPAMAELKQNQTVKQSIDFTLTVKELDPEKGATLEVVYDAVKFNIDSANFKGEFDSATPAPEPGTEGAAADEAAKAAEEALRPVVGTVVTVTLDPSGKVTEVEGGDALGGIGVWGQVASQFREREIVSSFIEPILNTRNEKGEAAIGDTWTYIDALPESPLGSFRIVTDHTLDSIAADDATVTLSGKIESVTTPDGADEPGFTIKESTNTGTYVWDTKAGVLKRLKQDQSVTMSAEMQGMPMNIDNTTTIQITRKDGPANPAPAPASETAKPSSAQ